MKNRIAPSILSADFKRLGEQLKETEAAGAEYIHFDVMDGMFVPSISFGMPVLAYIKGHTQQVMDVHLMVTEPIRYVEDFAKAGADILTVHVEACENLVETVDKIHACGMKAGVSIKPNTPVSALEPVLDKNGDVSDHVCRTGIWRTGIYSGVVGQDQRIKKSAECKRDPGRH